MEQNRTKLTLLNLAALLIAGGAGLAIARSGHVLSGQVALSFVAIGFLVSLVGYFQMRLVERERLERLEYDELTQTPSASALFNKDDGGSLPARRSREQFEKYFLPGFTTLLMLAEGAGAFLLWRWLDGTAQSTLAITRPLFAAVVFGLFALILFLLGRFSVTLARLEKQRLLQPVASFVLASAYISAVVVAGIVAVYAGADRADYYVARVLVILLGLLAAETFFTLLLEIYRPRVKGRDARLLYDSRLIRILSQPESLFTTAAHALDYQFGFKVSDTWFFQFLRRSFLWILLGQFALLVLSTTFVVIETGEQALLERFGRPVAGSAVLEPGLHFKWPWPIDRAHRYRTEQIQTFTVGIVPDEDRELEKTILWTVSHYKEEFNLLVAARDATGAGRSPPVNLLSVSIPVQFQITNLAAWAYNNREPDELLEKVATREVVLYLVNADLNEIMASGRRTAAEALRLRIQAASDARQLGARIVFVGLQDIHPPVAVAHHYEEVVGARQSTEARVNAAKAYATRTNAAASSLARRTVLNAEADAVRRKSIAVARAASFTNQIPAYRAAPGVYRQRAYLQALAREGGDARKYVIATTNTDDVILFNLEDKFQRDLLDIQIPPPTR